MPALIQLLILQAKVTQNQKPNLGEILIFKTKGKPLDGGWTEEISVAPREQMKLNFQQNYR